MKKLSFLFFPIIVVTMLGCFGCNTGTKNIKSDSLDGIELTVEAGEHWLGKMKVFIFSLKKAPQMAAWIEDEAGNYVSTITVTSRNAQKNWKSSPKEGRPEALPIWNHRYHSQNDIDTVSTATPKGSVKTEIDSSVLIDGNIYNTYLEINHSFDYNGFWTEDNSGVNGQPSLLYHAQFITGELFQMSLTPIGHGSVDGSNGNITSGLESFTSALSIIKNAYIVGK